MSKKPSKPKAAGRPNVSDQLRKIIDGGELTRYRLSKLTGIGESALSKFMAGERGLSMKALDKIGAVLDLEVIAHGPRN